MSAQQSGNQRATTIFGLVLIALGLLFLVGQYVRLDIGYSSWPLFVIVPGVVLYLLAYAVGGQPGAGFAVAGSIVTTVGIVLLYQQATGHWESWAYAWALVGPAAVGFGLVTYGTLTRNSRIAQSGWPPLAIGIGIFLVGALFFEAVLGLGGEQFRVFGEGIVPALLVLVGGILIARSLLSRR